jgi:transcription elongation GreA/GreB family factor
MLELQRIDKAELRTKLIAHVRDELEAITGSHRDTASGATHAEARPENDKDTRALESTYLARGLAKRAEQLAEELVLLERFAVRSFTQDDPLALAALARIEDDDGERLYFLAPAGAGTKLTAEDSEITVVTPSSPLGRTLIGKHLDDELEFRSPQGARHLCITALR